MKNLFSGVLLALFLLFTSACTKLDLNDIGDFMYTPSLVLPIGNVSVDVGQLMTSIDSTYIKTDSASKMFYFEWVMPQDTLVAVDLHQYAQGAEFSKQYNLFDELKKGVGLSGVGQQGAVTLPADRYSFDFKELYAFDYNENIPGSKVYRIDSCMLTQATLNLDVSAIGITLSSTNHIEVGMKFPTIVVDGRPLTFLGKMTEQSMNLSDVYEDFPLRFSDAENSVPMELSFTLVSDGTAEVMPDAGIMLSTQFDFINLKSIFGYFYQKEALYENKFSVEVPANSIFEQLGEGNKLLIRDPQLKFVLKSNVGIPIEIQLDNLGVADKSGNKVMADFNGSSSMSKQLKMPELLPGGEVETTYTEVLLNRENGATNKLFTIVPQTFNADFRLFSHDVDAKAEHFLVGEPHVYVDANMVMPFVFDAGTVFGYDTIIDVDFSSIAPSDTFKIEALNLYFDIANSMPLSLDFSLDFLDAEGNVLFEGEPTKIGAAEVDAEGRAVAPSSQHLEVRCKGETIDKVLSAQSIGMSVTLSGKDADSGIYLQCTDSLSMKMSAFIKAAVAVDLDNMAGEQN